MGGISSLASGGRFGHGFISAGLSIYAGGIVGDGPAGFVTATVVGGTVSEITGGKFANGAQSAAFSYVVMWGASKIEAGGVEEVDVTANCNSIRCKREGEGWKQLDDGRVGEVEWTGPDVVSDSETDRLMIERKDSGGFEHSRRREHGSTGRVDKTCNGSECTSVLTLTTTNRPGTADSASLPNNPTDTFVQHSHPKGSGSANNNFGPGDHIFLTKGKVNYLLNSSGDLMVLEAHNGRIWQRTLTGSNAGKNEAWNRRLD